MPPKPVSRGRLALELLVNLFVPWLAYEVLMRQGWTELNALMAITVVPLVWGIGVLLGERRWDPVAIFSGASMVLSLLACLWAKDIRALQVRESYLTLLLGLVLLGSAVLRRPLLLTLVASQAPAELLARPEVARLFGKLTWGWGVVMVLEFAVKLGMIFTMSISAVLALGPWVQNGILALAFAWSAWLVRRGRREQFATSLAPEAPPA